MIRAKDLLTNKKFIAANLLFALFCAYFVFGLYLSYKVQNYTGWNDAIFNSDSYRVISDFFGNYESNYRTKVHPLYVLLIQPVVRFLYLFIRNEHVSIVLLQSAVGTVNVFLVYFILKRLLARTPRGRAVTYILTALFAVCMAQFTWTAVAESFVFGGCSLLIYWAYFAAHYKKPILTNGRLLAFAFICCIPLCITTTNFVCVVVSAPFFLCAGIPKENRHVQKKVVWTLLSYIIPVFTVTILSLIQKLIWPTSQIWVVYLGGVFIDLVAGTSLTEDSDWVRFNLTLSTLLTVWNTFFGYGIVSAPIEGTQHVTFGSYAAWQVPFYILFLIVFVYSVCAIVRGRRILTALPFALALALQYGMHCLFSVESVALYTPHVVPLILIIIGLGLGEKNPRETKAERYIAAGSVGYLALYAVYALIVNLVRMCSIVEAGASYYPVLNISIAGEFLKGLGFAAAALAVFFVVRLALSEGIRRIAARRRVPAAAGAETYALCSEEAAAPCPAEGGAGTGSASSEEGQSGSPSVRDDPPVRLGRFSFRREALRLCCGALSFVLALGTLIGCVSNDGALPPSAGNVSESVYYIFGMGLRDKYILSGQENNCTLALWKQDGEAEAVYTDLVIRTEDIDFANYTVEGTLQGSSFSLYENEEGIFFSQNGEITALSEGVHINIPTFEGYSNRLDMRRIFNELMVNILPEGPTPNFYGYGSAWYRDAAIVAMALEKTGNLSQIEEWLKSIDTMYDNRRDPELDETDNLGQVLYLQSLLPEGERNRELIEDIIAEAARIAAETESKDYIVGITDGQEHPVYQTRWLKFGLESLGLMEESAKYTIPDEYDSYAALCWFDGFGDIGSDIGELVWAENNDVYYPYLRVAKLHFYQIWEPVEYTTYPYTYEAESKLHSWHAAELLLYLYDCDTFAA